jgi:phage anti-repressor protein
LTKHFVKDIDYQVALHQAVKQSERDEDTLVETNFAPPTCGAKNETRGGHNKESYLLNIKTFKKLCLKSNTKKADEIDDYFIKLEEILHEIIKVVNRFQSLRKMD